MSALADPGAARRRPARVVFLSGYTHPAQYRKVELAADSPDVELVHLVWPDAGMANGAHLSANGRRQYRVQSVPIRWLGQAHSSHRVIYQSVGLGLSHSKPDVVHCEHEQESLLAAQTALARRWLRPAAPLILYSYQNLLRPRSLAVRLVCAYTLRAAQHIQCASTEAVQVLRRQGFTGATSVAPNFGVDTRYFAPRSGAALRAAWGLVGFVAGYVGRLVPEKGLDTFLEAAALAGPGLQVLMVGEGPERPALQALAARLGLADRVRWHPAVPYEQVADYLCALDVLVLPSRTQRQWKEQFGRVLVEAMACRVPVAGSNSGAIPETIGPAGRIFPEGDARALAAILSELSAQPDQRETLAEEGYRRVMEHFTVERLAAKMLSMWRELAMQGNAHRR